MIVTQTQRKLHQDHVARRALFFKPAPRLRLVQNVPPPQVEKPTSTLKVNRIPPGHPAFIGPLLPIAEVCVSRAKVIISAIAEIYDIGVDDLIGSRRTARVCEVRQIGYLMVRNIGKYSYPDIGRRFGGRDHSSVFHGARKIEARMERDAVFAAEMRDLQSAIAARLGVAA